MKKIVINIEFPEPPLRKDFASETLSKHAYTSWELSCLRLKENAILKIVTCSTIE